jgi:hypothetical protein
MSKWNVYITATTVTEVIVEAESQEEALKLAESAENQLPVRASKDYRVHRPVEDGN